MPAADVAGVVAFGAGVATSAAALVVAPTSGTTSGDAAGTDGVATVAPLDEGADAAGAAAAALPTPGHGGPPAGSTPLPRICSLGLCPAACCANTTAGNHTTTTAANHQGERDWSPGAWGAAAGAPASVVA